MKVRAFDLLVRTEDAGDADKILDVDIRISSTTNDCHSRDAGMRDPSRNQIVLVAHLEPAIHER